MSRSCSRIFSILLYCLSGLLLCIGLVLRFQTLLPPALQLSGVLGICLSGYGGSFFLLRCLPRSAGPAVMRRTFFGMFLLYLALLISFTLLDPVFSRRAALPHWTSETLSAYLSGSVNLVPFQTVRFFWEGWRDGSLSFRAMLLNLAGNLAAFLPFALFLPLLFPRLRRFSRFLLCTACISLAIELLQFAMLTGACDIDDLLLNTAGAALGFAVFRIPPLKRVLAAATFQCPDNS